MKTKDATNQGTNLETVQRKEARKAATSGRDADRGHFETALKMARTWLETDGVVTPMAFVETSTKILAVVLEFETLEQKLCAYSQVSEIAARADAQSVTLVNDSWVGTAEFNGRPSEDPNRSEALVVLLVNPDGRVETTTIHPYSRVNGKILWGTEERGAAVAEQFLLKPWAKTAMAA